MMYLITLAAFVLWDCFVLAELQVTTEFGSVQGTYLEASEGRRLAAFLGVPYARPPIGSLRFRAPQDPLRWQSVRMTKSSPPSCVQRKDKFFADFEGSKAMEPLEEMSEDCLYINIYVPDVIMRNITGTFGTGDDENGLPVMVWFHGGMFSQGSSTLRGPEGWNPDPRELAALGGIIVVSVQYRLGSFGFLFLDDEAAPGNVGILDQKLALSWIKRNIFAFGGDPTRITLAGQDSGGVSAVLQMLLEEDDSLYEQLILQSAGHQHPWSFMDPTESFQRSLKLAAMLGCPTSGSEKRDVALCMSKKSAEDIANKELGVVDSNPGINFNSPFVMTKDGNTLVVEPSDLLSQKMHKKSDSLKILIGHTKNEGSKALMYFLPGLFPNENLTNPTLTLDQFDKAVERIFANEAKQIQELVQFEYKNWTNLDDDGFRFIKAEAMVAESQWICPMEEMIDMVLGNLGNAAQIYRYKFGVRNPQSVWPFWSGVMHGDEMDYVFGRPLVQRSLYQEQDRVLSKFLIHSWAKFVRTGDPSGKDQRNIVGWPRFAPSTRYVLHIDDHQDATVKSEKTSEECAFWNKLLPKIREHQKVSCRNKEKISEKRKFLPIKLRKSTTTQPISKESLLASTSNVIDLASIGTKARIKKRRKRPDEKQTDDDSFFPKVRQAKPNHEPDPVNSLQQKSQISVDTSDFTLINSTRVVASDKLEVQFPTEPDQVVFSDNKDNGKKTEKMPGNQRLSTQLSVFHNGSQRPLASNPRPWNLYQPQSPGNSPIYVASDVMSKKRHESTNSILTPSDIVYRRRPRPTSTPQSSSYYPFVTKKRRFTSVNRRMDKPDEGDDDDDDDDEVKQRPLFYYPNYIPTINE